MFYIMRTLFSSFEELKRVKGPYDLNTSLSLCHLSYVFWIEYLAFYIKE